MNWINSSEKRPNEDGAYIASIRRKVANGIFVFNYVAYYNRSEDKWYKYNPFTNDSQGELIEDQIIGWLDRASVFLGQ